MVRQIRQELIWAALAGREATDYKDVIINPSLTTKKSFISGMRVIGNTSAFEAEVSGSNPGTAAKCARGAVFCSCKNCIHAIRGDCRREMREAATFTCVGSTNSSGMNLGSFSWLRSNCLHGSKHQSDLVLQF